MQSLNYCFNCSLLRIKNFLLSVIAYDTMDSSKRSCSCQVAGGWKLKEANARKTHLQSSYDLKCKTLTFYLNDWIEYLLKLSKRKRMNSCIWIPRKNKHEVSMYNCFAKFSLGLLIRPDFWESNETVKNVLIYWIILCGLRLLRICGEGFLFYFFVVRQKFHSIEWSSNDASTI